MKRISPLGWLVRGLLLAIVLGYAAFCSWALDQSLLPPKPSLLYSAPVGAMILLVLYWMSTYWIRNP